MSKTGSLLTKTHRGYLKGNPDDIPGKKSAERALRSRIRQRIIAGMDDFSLLLQELGVPDEESVFNEASRTDAFAFLTRQDVRNLFPDPELEYPSSDAIAEIEAKTDLELAGNPGKYRDSRLTVLQMEIEEALRRAIAAEVPEPLEPELRNYDIDIDVDIRVEFSQIDVRLNVAELEHKLQEGELSFQDLREEFADGKITLQELQQLTRDEEIDGEPTPEYREELLSRPVPMLEGEPPEGYMRIRNENPGTKRLHSDDYMPPEYDIRFDENNEAVVLEDVGETVVENLDSIEKVTYD